MKKQPEITDITRQKIIDAFWTIYMQKPIDKISIKEITEAAYVHRSTFYRYFTDIYDVLNQFEQQVLDKISLTIESYIQEAGHMDLFSLADVMSKTLIEYVPIVYHLTNSGGDLNFRRKLQELAESKFFTIIEKNPNTMESKFLFHFMFTMMLSNFNFWYENQETYSFEQVRELSKELIQDGFAKYMKH